MSSWCAVSNIMLTYCSAGNCGCATSSTLHLLTLNLFLDLYAFRHIRRLEPRIVPYCTGYWTLFPLSITHTFSWMKRFILRLLAERTRLDVKHRYYNHLTLKATSFTLISTIYPLDYQLFKFCNANSNKNTWTSPFVFFNSFISCHSGTLTKKYIKIYKSVELHTFPRHWDAATSFTMFAIIAHCSSLDEGKYCISNWNKTLERVHFFKMFF